MENIDYLTIGRASDVSNKTERRIYRAFEMLPGVLAWLTIAVAVVLSFQKPLWVALFIIIFDMYWLIKTFYMTLHLRVAYAKLKQNMKIDWLRRLEDLPTNQYSLQTIKHWQDMYHLVLLPMYKESVDLVTTTLESLAQSNYPKNKMLVVLGLEQRAGAEFNQQLKQEITTKYGDSFLRLHFTEHPSDLTGELAGKGSNIAWAGKWAKQHVIDPMLVSSERIIVSAFDIDTVVYPEYFSRLTYVFLTSPDPLHASYQPVPFYANNIWEAPAFARVVAFCSTFWQTILQERFESATTFSSHSMPLQTLIDVGFWQTNVVSEDSRIFWQCLLRYNGNYRIQPIAYPVSMDANVAHSFWQTMINVYKQQRRWGYGAENTAYFLFGFWKNKTIPLQKKWFYAFTIIEGFWSWATNAMLIFVLGWLPLLVGGARFNTTLLSYNLPRLTTIIMNLALVGLVSMAILSIFVLPPRPPRFGKFKHLWMLLQWLLFPVTQILLGAFPGLEAQTRLMLGKYMGFWVTPKVRK